jgi:hypothetical protein
MFALLIIVILVVACLLAGIYGVDSRIDERTHRHSGL